MGAAIGSMGRADAVGNLFGSSRTNEAFSSVRCRQAATLGDASASLWASMKYLHTMVRVRDLEESLDFYCNKLGLVERRRKDSEKGRFTLVYLSAPDDEGSELELTYNWDSEEYAGGRNFGHVAYLVDDIYDLCQRLMDAGVTINRPPRDGHMAFVRSPDNISIELLQQGQALPPKEPWVSMPSTGAW
jgi:lactoylglutathione lyase